MVAGTHHHPPAEPLPGFFLGRRIDFGAAVGPGDHWITTDGRLAEGSPYRDIIKPTPPSGYPGDHSGETRPPGRYAPHQMHTGKGILTLPMTVPSAGQPYYGSVGINPDIGWSDDHPNMRGDKLDNGYHLRVCMRVDGTPGWGAVMLIMPQGDWPQNGEFCWPEVDGTTNWITKGYHHQPHPTEHPVWPLEVSASSREWHIYDIITTTSYYEYRLDGEPIWQGTRAPGLSGNFLGSIQCGLAGDRRPSGAGAVYIDMIEVYATDSTT